MSTSTEDCGALLVAGKSQLFRWKPWKALHRGAINRAALEAFVDGGIAEDTAKQVVTLIAAGSIPAVSINY